MKIQQKIRHVLLIAEILEVVAFVMLVCEVQLVETLLFLFISSTIFSFLIVSMFYALYQRITIPEIKNHPWFLKNLPADLMDEMTMGNQFEEPDQPMQSIDTIMQIIAEATIPAVGIHNLSPFMDSFDMDDDMDDLDSESELDVDSSGEIVYAI